ncbi:MAG: hypothetical protein F4Y49_01930 [Dehalococcoidia bacterium]|nr:hypothetical protein [Dehalococcoidia bacterium]
MAKEESYPTRLLNDSPADKDAFGGHERVARAIAEVVRTEDGGRSIGLEGGWGTGKSTIVKLTTDILDQRRDGDYKVAVFDTWAHQDDPLRRTFLENLIKRLQEIGWVKGAKWDQRTDELARRRREETTSVIPRLTGWGFAFAFTLLAIAPGSALMAAGATLLAAKDPDESLAAWLLVAGSAAAFAPAVFFAIRTVIRLCVRLWRLIFKSVGSDEELGLSELPSLVTGQASTKSKSVVFQTPDPTSVEFESIFGELLNDALKPKRRKLLLVIDNLDRVQSSDALSIWSTLQTFLGHSDYTQAEWINRLWVLIPYDGDAILRLWDGSSRDGTESEDGTVPDPAKSFLDKTFQLRFTVPPLLLLNWREFLQKTLQQAFPGHQEADFDGVYRIFAVEGGLEKSAPTPRDLKLFVNQIGILHRVWQDRFPLSHLACYVLLQKKGRDVRTLLLSGIDWQLASQTIGNNWREVLAALHFGVPPQEARQLLLRGPIENALGKGDGCGLSELEGRHPEGFWIVLEDTLRADSWANVEPIQFAHIAIALSDSRLIAQNGSRQEATNLQSSIQTAAAMVRSWAPFDKTTAEGMVAVAHLVRDLDEVVPALLSGASSTTVEESGNAPGVWMTSVFTLIKGLLDLDLSSQMEKGISVPLSVQDWLNASTEVAESDPDGQLLQYLNLQAISQIDEQMAQYIGSNRMDVSILNAANAALMTKSRGSMADTAGAAFSRVRSGQSFQLDQLSSILKMLRFSKEAGLITQDQLVELARSGYYLHYLYYAVAEGHSESIGECMFGHLQFFPDASQHGQVGNSRVGHDRLTRILQHPDTVPSAVDYFTSIVKQAQQLPVVFEMAAAVQPVSPFVAKVLRTLLISGDVTKPHSLVRTHWQVIQNVLRNQEDDSPSFEVFLTELPELDNLVASVVDGDFDVSEGGLYSVLLRISDDTDFRSWCTNRLSNFSQDIWSSEITSGGELVELVTELKARGAHIDLGSTYFDALIDHAEKIAEGQDMLPPDDNWHERLTLLNPDQQKLFPRRAYRILEESNGRASAGFFNLFGDMISDRQLLANEQRFIDRVCTPILETENVAGMAWVAGIAKSIPKLLREHGDQAAANDFKDRVQNHLYNKQDDDPIFSDLKTIGKSLRIKVP